jgi:hypothetical protein
MADIWHLSAMKRSGKATVFSSANALGTYRDDPYHSHYGARDHQRLIKAFRLSEMLLSATEAIHKHQHTYAYLLL